MQFRRPGECSSAGPRFLLAGTSHSNFSTFYFEKKRRPLNLRDAATAFREVTLIAIRLWFVKPLH
jgi:hypothetical protein